MKVTLQKDYKRLYTVADLDHAHTIIKYMKDDDETAAGYAKYAISEALKGTSDICLNILSATAETTKNCRAWNIYGDDTGNMDVWIEAIAKTCDGFVEVGAYLTDIWQTGDDYCYKNKMYIQRYVRE